MRITIVGAGYVGLSLAALLGQYNDIIAVDIDEVKVKLINDRISPIREKYLEKFIQDEHLNLVATTDYQKAFKNTDYIVICTPTNYDEKTNCFDTYSVEDTIRKVLEIDKETPIIIKSTVPVGFTENMKKKYNTDNIIFSPEFLREDRALVDNLYPSRIIVGEKSERAATFATLLQEAAYKTDIPILLMNSTEAEAVKLFANTYLALRVSYFNELDTYAEMKGLNSKDIIEGVSLDPRIGDYYNNPSFGYGGYCLPKDTKQLLANYQDIPQNMIDAIIKSNDTRKHHIANMILKKNPRVVGVYRLVMKTGSDNFRSSAIQDVIQILKDKGVNIIIYEPSIRENTYNGFEIVHDLKLFKEISDVIIVNRTDHELDDAKEFIYTRDIFRRD